MIKATLPISLQADLAARSLRGLAVPWNTDATVSDGSVIRFLPGSVDLSGVPVVLHHNEDRPIGRVSVASDDETGHNVTASISQVADGDEALILASDKVLTGLSVGVDPTEYEMDGDVLVVSASTSRHLGLVTSPAFATARVVDVAASAAEGATAVPETSTETPTETTATETPVQASTGPTPVTPTPRAYASAPLPTVGEFIYAALKRKSDPVTFARAEAALRAAAPHTLYPDVSGLAYKPLLGPLVDSFAPASRPVSEAFGVRGAPSGVPSFLRPSVTAHGGLAVAAAEKTDVTSGPITVGQATVTMTFIKTARNISAEAVAFTSTDVMGLVAEDLVRAYLLGFDQVVVTGLTAAATGTALVLAKDGTDAVAQLAAGSAYIYGQTYTMPDLLIVAPDVWAKIAGWKGTDGRPLFPFINPTNAPGSTEGITSFGMNILGLRPVVTFALAAGKAFLASKSWFEVYESSRVDMRVDEPTILGTALGIGGAVGTWAANGKGLVPVSIAP